MTSAPPRLPAGRGAGAPDSAPSAPPSAAPGDLDAWRAEHAPELPPGPDLARAVVRHLAHRAAALVDRGRAFDAAERAHVETPPRDAARGAPRLETVERARELELALARLPRPPGFLVESRGIVAYARFSSLSGRRPIERFTALAVLVSGGGEERLAVLNLEG